MSQGLGLDSLEFAVLVVRLEDVFGFDPFLSGRVEQFPHTVGDLVALYEQTGGND